MHTTLRELIYGLRRRHARRPEAQGDHPRRIVGADPAAGPARHAGRASTRWPKAGSLLGSAGIIVMDDTTCMVWAGEEPAALLPARVVRQVHAVPRRRRLALQAPAAHRARRRARCGTSTCCSASPNNIVGKTLCAFGDAAATPVLTTMKLFRARVRGARPRGPLHAAGRLARTQHGGCA